MDSRRESDLQFAASEADPGSLPAPAAVVAGELALTANAPVPSLSSLYLTPVTDSTPLPAFKAPRPPGNKYAWAPAAEVIPHEEDAYFPMWCVDCSPFSLADGSRQGCKCQADCMSEW